MKVIYLIMLLPLFFRISILGSNSFILKKFNYKSCCNGYYILLVLNQLTKLYYGMYRHYNGDSEGLATTNDVVDNNWRRTLHRIALSMEFSASTNCLPSYLRQKYSIIPL